jgi:hypothetical protein
MANEVAVSGKSEGDSAFIDKIRPRWSTSSSRVSRADGYTARTDQAEDARVTARARYISSNDSAASASSGVRLRDGRTRGHLVDRANGGSAGVMPALVTPSAKAEKPPRQDPQ